MSAAENTAGPVFRHDCEVSLEKCVGKCHYLGTQVDSAGEAMDLYIHVREAAGRSELLARWGSEGEEYLSASLGTILFNSTASAAESAGPEGYGVRLAYDAAGAAGYDLAKLAFFVPLYDEDPDQARNDAITDGGNPYTDAAGMVDEGADNFEEV